MSELVDHPAAMKAFQPYGFKAGFLKLAILKIVSKGPTHGYALIKEIERLTSEDWKPSPGSIYPALQELETQGLISQTVEGRRKIYEITPMGQEVTTMVVAHAHDVLKHLDRLLSS
jgi:DNA-binding PadR family transcriptional regulator